MKDEIKVGVEFLRQFLSKYGQLTGSQIDLFASKLTSYLEQRYVNHWYESKPMKGQAFRCLRLKRSENYVDPVLEIILNELNLGLNQLGLPNDFTLWIDPGEVSVRFGDQFGYTYTIAKLNTNFDSVSQATQPCLDFENLSLTEKSTNESKLIVQNSEKIFDEKFTAFIRQNSCSSVAQPLNKLTKQTSSSIDLNFSLNDLQNDEDELNSNDLYDKLANLSAEKRTISPPCAASPVQKQSLSVKRTNSSNITISNTNGLGNNEGPQSNNRLSYNDSCYYSSSSSSCASSFGSNYDESLAQYGWFKNEPSLITNPTSSQFAQTQISPFSNQLVSQTNSLAFLNEFSPITSNGNTSSFESFGNNNANSQPKLNYMLTGINNFNNGNNSSLFSSLQNHSDTSSDRSDTPNSCITTSSFGNNANSFNSFNSSFGFDEFLQANADLNENYSKDLNLAENNPILLDSSSSSSTSTTIFANSNNNKAKKSWSSKSPKKGSDTEDKPEGGFKEKQKRDGSQQQQQQQNGNKNNNKEDTYCGYVESFPYYYKLNRLYNALAVQKMQTERLRKSGLLNNTNMNNPVAVANALATLGQLNPRSSLNAKQNNSLSSSPSTPPPLVQGIATSPKQTQNKNLYSMSPTAGGQPAYGNQHQNSKQFRNNGKQFNYSNSIFSDNSGQQMNTNAQPFLQQYQLKQQPSRQQFYN